VIISYQGVECFKISQGDLTLAFNPISKDSKAGEPTRFGADITLISANHADTNGREQTSRGDNESFLIEGPGEYEVREVFIKGYLSEAKDGLLNTVYLVTFEGLKLCFLGSLANPELKSDVLENLEDIDILFVPIGGGRVLEPAAAYKLAVSLEPSVIIPMHYEKATLEQFLKEGGQKVEPIEKFVVKKKDLEGKEGEIVVLKEDR
jgi:L-ascorbate metabolism protein UlaG (beta-lactamase superfamily)